MFISKAYAQAAVEIGDAVTTTAAAPSTGQAFMTNMAMVLVLVFLFYFLMIRPQQKRFREHSEMLSELKKGDKVVTGGGLVGTIEKITGGEPEITVALEGGMKVTALRNTLQKHAPAPDTKKK